MKAMVTLVSDLFTNQNDLSLVLTTARAMPQFAAVQVAKLHSVNLARNNLVFKDQRRVRLEGQLSTRRKAVEDFPEAQAATFEYDSMSWPRSGAVDLLSARLPPFIEELQVAFPHRTSRGISWPRFGSDLRPGHPKFLAQWQVIHLRCCRMHRVRPWTCHFAARVGGASAVCQPA